MVFLYYDVVFHYLDMRVKNLIHVIYLPYLYSIVSIFTLIENETYIFIHWS